MKIKTLADVYADQLQDMHSAETQLVGALPRMATAAAHDDLKAAFNHHLEETREHKRIMDELLSDLGLQVGRKKCRAMEGLIEEGAEVIREAAEENARDAGLIVAAQKVEHYEIAAYGCLREFAALLELAHHARAIQQILDQEKAADVMLSRLATSAINTEAMIPK